MNLLFVAGGAGLADSAIAAPAVAQVPAAAEAAVAVPAKPSDPSATPSKLSGYQVTRPFKVPALGTAPAPNAGKVLVASSPATAAKEAKQVAEAKLASCLTGSSAQAKAAKLTHVTWCASSGVAADEPLAVNGAATAMSMTGCPIGGDVAWTAPNALRVANTQTFSVSEGASIVVTTSDLAPVGNPFPSANQDTVLYLLRCGAAGCHSGTIVRIDDDGNSGTSEPFDSRIAASNLPAGTYFALVTAYGPGAQGQATVTWQIGSDSPSVWPQTAFGGMEFLPDELRRGDALLVGKSPDTSTLVAQLDGHGGRMYPGLAADPEFADSVAWVLSTRANYCSGTGGDCGSYWSNDDAWWFTSTQDSVLLSRVLLNDIPAELPLTQARVLAGPYHPWVEDAQSNVYVRSMNLRAMHIRRSTPQGRWDCPEQLDNDGDGLTWELEQALGSCDLVTDVPSSDMGAVGLNCQAWGDAINGRVNYWKPQASCPVPAPCPYPASNVQGHVRCWSARDSDNDGMNDLAEVWALAARFGSAPTPPLNEIGSPTWLTLFDAGGSCPGAWCAGENLSARSDPQPHRFDIYMQLDAVNCAGSQCAAVLGSNPTSHALVPEQAATFFKFWTDTPWRRWDGTAPPYASLIAPENELAYLIRMHAYPGSVHNLPDTLALGEAVWQGAHGAKSYFDQHYDVVWKALRLGNYGLLMPNQGQANSGVLVASNLTGSAQLRVDQAINPIAHEIGHVLGLAHPHNNWVRPDLLCDGRTAVAAGQCSPTICSANPPDLTCACTPFGAATCQATVNSPGPNNGSNNPAVPSLMNYRYFGGLTPGPEAPIFTGSPADDCTIDFGGVCEWQFASFSKGLGPVLAENALIERQTLNWSAQNVAPAWATVKFARELRCYNHSGDQPARSCAPFGLGAQSAFRGPDCSAQDFPAECWFNWDQDHEYDFDNVSVDLSRGQFVPTAGAGVCGADSLQDVDEWGKVLSLSRTLDKPTVYHGVALYRDVFNGTADLPYNYAGWPQAVVPVYTSSGFTTSFGAYKRNQCVFGQVCGSGSCVMPTCVVNADCAAGNCVGGVCQSVLGLCPCGVDSDCGQVFDGESDSCNTFLSPATCRTNIPPTELYGPDEGRQFESAYFPPGATNNWVRLTSLASSPLDTVATNDAMSLYFDFYWNGLEAGTTEQTLFESGAFRIKLAANGAATNLTAEVPGVFAVIPNSMQIMPNRWYRVGFFATKWGNFAWTNVTQKGLVSGTFDTTVDAPFSCSKRTITTTVALPEPGDVWIGSPVSGSGNGFRGRLDNIVLLNNHTGVDIPSGCQEVP